MNKEDIKDFTTIILGKPYVRFFRRALLIPLAFYSLDIFQLIALWIGYKFEIPLMNPWFGLASLLLIIIGFVVTHYFEIKRPPLATRSATLKEQKHEHDIRSCKLIFDTLNYDMVKRNLETAHNRLSSEFVDSLEIVEYFDSPRFRLFDKELEQLRVNFLVDVTKYIRETSRIMYPTGQNLQYYAILAKDSKGNTRSKYRKEYEFVVRRSKELFGHYKDFYSLAIQKYPVLSS